LIKVNKGKKIKKELVKEIVKEKKKIRTIKTN